MTTPATRTLGRLAALAGGTLLSGSPDQPIEDLAGLEDAEAGDLTFFDGNPKFKKAALATRAGAMLVRERFAPFAGAQVQVGAPYMAFQQLVNELYPEPARAPGIHPTAIVDAGATVDPTAAIGAHVTIEAGASVGARSVLHPHVHLARGATVGEDCVLYPHVTVWERSRLGNRVILHCGVVIGDDGFGYRRDESGHRKIRHVGHVELHDDVEVGANCTIDRGTYGRTVLGRGTKLDNLVHLAHNVKVGERTLIIAQTGVAGGARIGSDSIIGGQVAVRDGVTVGNAVMVIPQSGITRDVGDGEVVAGTPILPHALWRRSSIAVKYLPGLLSRVRAIEKKLGISSAAPPDEG